jgi:hypothetical protein
MWISSAFVSSGNRFEPNFPVFVSVARDGMQIYLSEHSGDCQVDGLVHFVIEDVDAWHREFTARGLLGPLNLDLEGIDWVIDLSRLHEAEGSPQKLIFTILPSPPTIHPACWLANETAQKSRKSGSSCQVSPSSGDQATPPRATAKTAGSPALFT